MMVRRAAMAIARMLLGSLLAMTIAVSGCGDDDGAATAGALPALHATRGTDPGIFDALGRQVILRGVNYNSLGDYYQASPQLPTVFPVDPLAFADMAAQGFNVVRLLISWSALEPERGQIDRDYLARVRAAVEAAAEAGIYVVLDMHQDAWGKYIATPADVVCPANSEPAIGWDGAPEWATITDGATTCRNPGSRENAPAVIEAFRNFYADRDGIMGRLVATWAEVAREFAGDSNVAGYDLLNEPHYVELSRTETAVQLGTFYSRAIGAIRQAEQEADGFAHIIFFEPLIHFPVPAANPPATFTNDTNIVFAPHTYAESFNPETLTLAQVFSIMQRTAERYGVTFWIGEYGWFGDPAQNLEPLRRFGQFEDRFGVGSTWWQWLQACGDPHHLQGLVASGVHAPTPEQIGTQQTQYHMITCPDGTYSEPIPEFRHILARPRVLAAPGRIVEIASDADAGTMTLAGDAAGAAPDARLEIWAPARNGAVPELVGAGLGAVEVTPVAGGFRIQAEVSGTYSVELSYR